jgi:hypothetical protein
MLVGDFSNKYHDDRAYAAFVPVVVNRSLALARHVPPPMIG